MAPKQQLNKEQLKAKAREYHQERREKITFIQFRHLLKQKKKYEFRKTGKTNKRFEREKTEGKTKVMGS